jgi:superfamily II DNA or RNA helicase
MKLKQNQVIKNLKVNEAVRVSAIHEIAGMTSIEFIGLNSQRFGSKMLSSTQIEELEIVTEEGVFDFHGNPERFLLFAEAERIHSAYQFDPLFAVNCSVIDPLPHQVEAVYSYLLPQPKIRFLLADDTGAGKTIMTGLLIKELLFRGMIERVLVITPGGLTLQWQDELAVKFNIPLIFVNRATFSGNPNIFLETKMVVSSIDFISQNDVMTVLGKAQWDLVIFDESHKLSAYDYGTKSYQSKRYQAAYQLSKQTDHLLLLTATPHRGRSDTFKRLLQLLDEDIFQTEDLASNRVQELEKTGVNKFFIRRLKEDMKDWNGEPLYKKRHTKTVAYQLTPEEKQLYDLVTKYLTVKKEEAAATNNVHVSLALTVMQRRLVSSIFAIKNTLYRRWQALQGIVDEVNKNPGLWKQRHLLSEFDSAEINDYDELSDEQRDALDSILSDPKKFKLFTTAKNIQEIQEEAKAVHQLYALAENLYQRQTEEQKFRKLQELLKSNGVLDSKEKLVIFTEHKDTLIYLEERLRRNSGYQVVTIHGGMSADERRQAQVKFAKAETQIMIATDAAGEGINLQFCRLLINWDIPWNPNRLEQRMGRIHRYGQKQDVMVFNLVASNTREGNVLERLLSKLDTIRESIGDDRVYDVIQDVLDDVALDVVIEAMVKGENTRLMEFLNQDVKQNELDFTQRIQKQRDAISHSMINYQQAIRLKEHSDEKRLQPIYIRLFFEKAMNYLGGKYREISPSVFQIHQFPESLASLLRKTRKISLESLKNIHFCFDKQIFLEYQAIGSIPDLHYINPGNLLFDALVDLVRDSFRIDMLRGTVLISPEAKSSFFAYFVRSRILDEKPSLQPDSIADETIAMVCKSDNEDFFTSSPAKFIDLFPPALFAKPITVPEASDNTSIREWAFHNITLKQFEKAQARISDDCERRIEFLESAFRKVNFDIQAEIAELQSKVLLGDSKASEKLLQKEQRIMELIERKKFRMAELEKMIRLSPKIPETLGCAYVVPLSQLEYQSHFGMARDDEAEAIAMASAMNYEMAQGWTPEDCSRNNEGYDIRSVSPEQIKRYIEVKGRNGDDGSVMLSENEMNRLAQLGDSAWLYIVTNCKKSPELHRIQNPANTLTFEQKSKGIQYYLPMQNWKRSRE